MSTSKYSQDYGSERAIIITISSCDIRFTIERYQPKKEAKSEKLRLAFNEGREKPDAAKNWEDNDEYSIEGQLSEILAAMLVRAEASYRQSLVSHRDWIIERKIDAEAELKRRKEEAERKAKEARERLERENIGRLLAQANALDKANRIRTYVQTARLKAAEATISFERFEKWASWANKEADRIDPLQNGLLLRTIAETSETEDT